MIPRRGRSHSSGNSRTSQRRPLKTRVLIVCEGTETEYNYLHHMKEEDEVKRRLAVTVKRGNGKSRQEIAESAIQHKEKDEARHAGREGLDDEAWCVMDVERADQRRDCERALKLLHENDIEPCLSNPAFEVWLLAHFEKTSRQFAHADAAATQLDKHWKKCFNQKYDKADSRIYDRLKERMMTAIENACWVRKKHHKDTPCILDCNSATDVYVLVRRLLESPDGSP